MKKKEYKKYIKELLEAIEIIKEANRQLANALERKGHLQCGAPKKKPRRRTLKVGANLIHN
jgi:hypothetical protein